MVAAVRCLHMAFGKSWGQKAGRETEALATSIHDFLKQRGQMTRRINVSFDADCNHMVVFSW